MIEDYSNLTPAESEMFLKSYQDGIKKQLEDRVVLYNVKSKNAFFVISPEEARFAMDMIKAKRKGEDHFCQITPLKSQKWYKIINKKQRNILSLQHISSLQILLEGMCFYAWKTR